MFTSNVQFGYPCPRDGGKLSRLVYLALRPGFGSDSVISQFLLHHNLGIFSCKRYKHYFSQTDMFSSNIQFGYPCPRGGRQAVQADLSCPPAQDLSQALSSVNSYCTIILEYLVVRVVNIISVKLRCLHLTISSVILVRGVGGKLSRLVYWNSGWGGQDKPLWKLASHPLSIPNIWSKHLRLTEIEFISLSTNCSWSGWCNKICTALDSLPPTPCQYLTQLNIWSKHLRLTEIKFISLSTKYSCSRWCNRICALSILSEILGVGAR